MPIDGQQGVHDVPLPCRIQQRYQRKRCAVRVPQGVIIVIIDLIARRGPFPRPVHRHQHRVVECGVEHPLIAVVPGHPGPVQQILPLRHTLHSNPFEIKPFHYFQVLPGLLHRKERDADPNLNVRLVESHTCHVPVHGGPHERSRAPKMEIHRVRRPVVPAALDGLVTGQMTVVRHLHRSIDKFLRLPGPGRFTPAEEKIQVQPEALLPVCRIMDPVGRCLLRGRHLYANTAPLENGGIVSQRNLLIITVIERLFRAEGREGHQQDVPVFGPASGPAHVHLREAVDPGGHRQPAAVGRGRAVGGRLHHPERAGRADKHPSQAFRADARIHIIRDRPGAGDGQESGEKDGPGSHQRTFLPSTQMSEAMSKQ